MFSKRTEAGEYDVYCAFDGARLIADSGWHTYDSVEIVMLCVRCVHFISVVVLDLSEPLTSAERRKESGVNNSIDAFVQAWYQVRVFYGCFIKFTIFCSDWESSSFLESDETGCNLFYSVSADWMI